MAKAEGTTDVEGTTGVETVEGGTKNGVRTGQDSLPPWRRNMRQRILLAGISLVFGVLFGTAHHARAQDGPFPIGLQVGETFDACISGQIVCPARVPICDDPKVAIPADGNEGLGFQGVGPGTTLCSAASAVGPRRIFRITVR